MFDRIYHDHKSDPALVAGLIENNIRLELEKAKMAIQITDLRNLLTTQATEITSLQARIAAQPAAPDLQPIADAILANTAAIVGTLPTPDPAAPVAAPAAQ